MTVKSPFNDSALVQGAYAWAQAAEPAEPPEEHYCPTRGVLEARMERLRRDAVRKGMEESASFLLQAVLLEIGSNSFDHNMGQWKDIPGVLSVWELEANILLVALVDRGQGVRTTLKRVVPTIASDADALLTAFLERVSGRAPERRGNGLKFVRETLLDDGIDLLFHSGTAQYLVVNKHEQWDTGTASVSGCLAVISCTLT